jgi:hypothetical protein
MTAIHLIARFIPALLAVAATVVSILAFQLAMLAG